MKIMKLGIVWITGMALLLSSCNAKDLQNQDHFSTRMQETAGSSPFASLTSDRSMLSSTETVHSLEQTVVTKSVCPRVDFAPDKSSLDREEPVKFVDANRDVKDLGTDLVIQSLFNSKDTLYRFMKLVYQTMEEALAAYRKERGLEDRAIFLLFKGGNVLRMVANEVFDQLGPDARDFMQKEYAPYFKRSDADFSVYVDEKKLAGYDYDLVFREVTELVFAQLNKIRSQFESEPEKYFNFFRLNSKAARSELARFFLNLNRLPAVLDPANENWFNAKFLQLQFRDQQAEPGAMCFYRGQYDYRYELKDAKLVATRISEEPHWIFNTDNRTQEWAWGSDPSKKVKFSLLRSKVALEYTFEKDGAIKRKPIGGELIDVSMPHRNDDRLRDFLDRYDETVAEYTLIADDMDDKFVLKAYSFANLVEDLQFIILDSFDRPWEGGPKYVKRVNRLFFLFSVEMLTAYGLSYVAKEYLDGALEKIIVPLNKLYPLNPETSTKIVEQVKYNIGLINGGWNKMPLTNHFWTAFGSLVERIVKNPKEGDQEGFQGLLEAMEKNIELAKELVKMKYMKINQDEVYNVETKNLF